MTHSVKVEQVAQSRVMIYPVPPALPHKCASCGCSHNNDGRVYLDFKIHIDYYGAVYICSLCIVEIMNNLGWLSPEQRDSLKAENSQLQLDNAELRGRVVAYGNALSGLIGNEQLELALNGPNPDEDRDSTADKVDRTAKSVVTKQRSNDVPSTKRSESSTDLIL